MAYAVPTATVTNPGSGYTSAPSVSFTAAPSGGTTAVGTAVYEYVIRSVEITNGGSGYVTAPTVTFTAAPSGGTDATGTANLAAGGNDASQNLFWARQTLAGQQLRVQVGGGE